MKFLEKFAEIAGNLGFLVGDGDRRREQSRKAKRTWGASVDGITLSASANTPCPSPDEPLRIDVALRNIGTEPKTFSIGAWIEFFTLTIIQPDGTEAALTAFGKRQFEAARKQDERKIVVAPEQEIDADLPAGALYELRQTGVYRIVGKCQKSRAVSNEFEIRI